MKPFYFKVKYITPTTQAQKYDLMKFMYDNTDSFVMNTFGYLWETRGWWEKFPIQITTLEHNTSIVGMHAFTLNTKAPDTLKTYYIAVGKTFRGQGVAKKMTIDALRDHELFCKRFYVNSVEGSDGTLLYDKIFKNGYRESPNEFGRVDHEYEDDITNILK